jgi:hypothetical protein
VIGLKEGELILPGTIGGLDCPRQSKSGPGDRTTRRWWQAEALTEGVRILAKRPRRAPSTIWLRRMVPLPVPGGFSESCATGS